MVTKIIMNDEDYCDELYDMLDNNSIGYISMSGRTEVYKDKTDDLIPQLLSFFRKKHLDGELYVAINDPYKLTIKRGDVVKVIKGIEITLYPKDKEERNLVESVIDAFEYYER